MKGKRLVSQWPNIEHFNIDLHEGDVIDFFKSGLDRYGEFIVTAISRSQLDNLMVDYSERIKSFIDIE